MMKLDLAHLIITISMCTILASCGGKEFQNARVSSNGAITISFLTSNTKDDTAKLQTDIEESYTPGNKLIATDWGQDFPFNGLFPAEYREYPVGCLPTALSMLLNYHRPSIIRPMTIQHNVMAPEGYLRYGNYLWDEIAKYEDDNSSSQIGLTEIQKIARDIGHTMSTQYNVDGSATSLEKIRDFTQHFGFKSNFSRSKIEATVDDEENFVFDIPQSFKDNIINNINNFEPVLLSLLGRKIPLAAESNLEQIDQLSYHQDGSESFEHAIIIDGYKYDEEGKLLFHINWGWGGLKNGFYPLDGGIKLILTEANNRSSLVYIPTMEIFYNFQKCSSDEECPNVAMTENITNYNSQNGVIISNTSANHLRTFLTTLEIDQNPIIRNFSGFYKLHFLHESSGLQFSYSFRRYGPRDVTRLNFEASEFPLGRYQISISSLETSSRVDLNNLPIRFSINKEDSTPFTKVANLTTSDSEAAAIGLDDALPLARKENDSNTVLIPIHSPSPNFHYQLRMLEENSSATLVQDYLVLNNSSEEDDSIQVKIGLFAINLETQSESLIDQKDFTIITSDKNLQIANPNTNFIGQLSANSSSEFYLYAEGRCEISGSRGYANQSFFYSLEGLSGQTFDQIAGSIRTTRLTNVQGVESSSTFILPAGFYKLTAGPSYRYRSYVIAQKSAFSLNINCDQISTPPLTEVLNFYNQGQ